MLVFVGRREFSVLIGRAAAARLFGAAGPAGDAKMVFLPQARSEEGQRFYDGLPLRMRQKASYN
jgi:hypothetical protein